MPTASIIIPAYNAEAYIGDTLKSVFAQTWTDFECIVIDDGSTDNTASIIKSFTDNRLRYYPIPNSGGPARPRNIGIHHARGDYIFLFDADDLMHPQKLAVSLDAFQQYPEADFLFTNYRSIDEQGKLLKNNSLEDYETLWQLVADQGKAPAQFISRDSLYPALVKVNFIGTSSVGLRASALRSRFVFNENLKNSDDRLFWVTFSKLHDGIFINSMLHSYRVCRSGISRKNFIERAPGKISALEMIKDQCENEALIAIVKKQISDDYANLAYSYGKRCEYKNQIIASVRSFSHRVNFNAIKLLLKGVVLFLINRK